VVPIEVVNCQEERRACRNLLRESNPKESGGSSKLKPRASLSSNSRIRNLREIRRKEGLMIPNKHRERG
jgi:hypothetical protein